MEIRLILVETEETFELFDDIEKAFNYCKVKKFKKIKKIDLVECNKDNIYFEENGDLNYKDNSLLIKEGILSNIY